MRKTLSKKLIKDWGVTSETSGSMYKVKLFADRHWECSCPSYEYANNKYCAVDPKTGEIIKSCKHIEYIKELYEERKSEEQKTTFVNL